MQYNFLGRHILVEYYNCNSDKLIDPDFIEKHMVEAAVRAKATVVTSDFHHFKPYGVSGAVIISESHLTIHTWPEYGYAAVDLFTCGDINPWLGFDYLEEIFESERSESIEIPRGMTEKIRKFSHVPLGEITFKPM